MEKLPNWFLWCRLCAKDDPQSNKNVDLEECNDEFNLITTIEKFFHIHVTIEKNFPFSLCKNCIGLLKSLSIFKKRVTEVHTMFNELQEKSINSKDQELEILQKFNLNNNNIESFIIPEVHYTDENIIEMKNQCNQIVDVNDPLEHLQFEIKTESIDIDVDISRKTIQTEDTLQSVNDAKIFKDESNESKIIVEPIRNLNEENVQHINNIQETAKFVDIRNNDDDTNEKDDRYYYTCLDCEEKFKNIVTYRLHVKRAHSKVAPDPEYKCKECSKVFKALHALTKHKRIHLPPEVRKILPCSYCDKKFPDNHSIQWHVKCVHMDERPFVCDKCGYAVRTTAALKEHMLTHTDEMPFECAECHKRFKNVYRLNAHKLSHTEVEYKCNECEQQFSSRMTLNRHLLVHTDESQHKCDYCGRAFKRSKTLKAHLILHTGLKPYSCDFCERTFASGANCRSHKKKQHPVELAALEASGGAKKYTFNIPKLDTLKALTRNSKNLEPVASKSSGNFAFGKKHKLERLQKMQQQKMTDETAAEATKVMKIDESNVSAGTTENLPYTPVYGGFLPNLNSF